VSEVSTLSPASDFETLVRRVEGCRACAGVEHTHLLGASNGRLDAPLLVVGEAPGRLGASRTGVPFHGDRAGDRFEALLAEAHLARRDVFVTNAVLCSPRSEAGTNRRPRPSEVTACLDHLRATLEVVRAPVVAALGRVALDALAGIEPHNVGAITPEAGRPRSWAGRTLVPLVHPSGRTLGRRSEAQQRADWRALGTLVRREVAEGAWAL